MHTLAGYGVPQDLIAAKLKISAKTLRKHYDWELKDGKATAISNVTGRLYERLKEKNCPPALICFYLKTQAGWKETHKLEHTGAEGGPLVIYQTIGDDKP